MEKREHEPTQAERIAEQFEQLRLGFRPGREFSMTTSSLVAVVMRSAEAAGLDEVTALKVTLIEVQKMLDLQAQQIEDFRMRQPIRVIDCSGGGLDVRQEYSDTDESEEPE